jgi:O-antigen/teichoic acid export membrane protein
MLAGAGLRNSSPAWILIGTVVSAGLMLVSFRIIGDIVGVEAFGGATLWYGAVQFIAGSLLGPVGQALSRFVFDTKTQSERSSLWATTIAIAFGCTGALLCCVLLARFLGLSNFTTTELELSLVAAFTGESLKILSTAFLQVQRRFRSLALIQILDAGLRPLAVAALAHTFEDAVLLVLVAYMVAVLTAGVIGVALCSMECGVNAVRWIWSRRIWGFGWPLAGTYILGWLAAAGDRYVIGSIMGTRAVGVFVATTSIGGRLALTPAGILDTFFLPSLYAAVAQDDWPGIRKEAYRWLISILVYGAILLVALLLCLTEIVELLLPHDFRIGSSHLLIASYVAAWIHGASYIPLRLLYALGRTAVVMRVEAFSIAGKVALLLGLGTIFGLEGVAWALVLASAARTGLSLSYAFRHAQTAQKIA